MARGVRDAEHVTLDAAALAPYESDINSSESQRPV
jgi:hypothetical protein